MTEEQNEQEQQQAVESQGEGSGNQETKIDNLDDAIKEIQKLRREAAGRRVKNKELEEAAHKWQEHLDSQKTELEKLTERANAAEKEAADMRAEALRAKILAEFSIDPDLSDLLVGETEDELKAKAKKLSELKGKSSGKRPDFFAGQRGQAVAPAADDLNSWFKQLWKDVDSKSTRTSSS